MKIRHVMYIGVLFIATGAAIFCSGNASGARKKVNTATVLHVGVCRVIKDSVALPLRIPGRLATSTELKLGFRTGGVVRRIMVDEGMTVGRGTPLARLDTIEFSAWRTKASTAFKKAGRDLERAEKLFADSVVTREQLQNARSAYDAAKADLSIARFNFDQALLTAPARGKILKRCVENNEVTGPGMPVIIMASTEDAWIVKAAVPDVDLPQLSHGDSARVRFDAIPGKQLTARLVKISPAAHPVTGTFEIECALDSTEEGFRHGLFAEVTLFPLKQRQYVFIPASALAVAEGDSGTVIEARGNGKAYPVRVAVERMFGDLIAVSGGLASVEEVVSAGAMYALTTNDSLVFDR